MPREDEFSAGPYDLSRPPAWESFPGLYPPLYTQTPDVFFDWVAPFLPEIELRVLLYLIRRTLGFKKQGDQITVEQICSGIVTREGVRLDWGAQLGERSVQRALAGLETKGLIERHRQLDPERGWRPSYIRLRLCDQSGQEWQARQRAAPTPGGATDTRGVSGQTPGRRTPGHLPGDGPGTPPPPAAPVRPDTYKRQILPLETDQQETGAPPTEQETDGEPGAALWEAIKAELAAVLAPGVYHGKVAGTRQLASPPGEALTVGCPDAQTCRWLEQRLGRRIAEIGARLAGADLPVRFVPLP